MHLHVLDLPFFTLADSVFPQQVGAEMFLHHKSPSIKQKEQMSERGDAFKPVINATHTCGKSKKDACLPNQELHSAIFNQIKNQESP